MKTKTCKKCVVTKPVDMFYVCRNNLDQLHGSCKSCHIISARNRRHENIEYCRAYDRTRSLLPHRKKQRNESIKKYCKKYPDRVRAVASANYAIRIGRLKRQPCEVCGTKENIHAHHYDYSKPLGVTWLCAIHHMMVHSRKCRHENFNVK